MADPAPGAAPVDASAAAPTAAPAAAYAPDADTWDHVVRAAAHCGQLKAAALLMRVTRAHAHDPELLARTRGVRGGKLGRTLLMRAVIRGDVARAAEIVGAAPTPAARAELLVHVDVASWTALHLACSSENHIEALPWVEIVDRRARRVLRFGFYTAVHSDEDAALALVELLLGAGADPLSQRRVPGGLATQPIHLAARWSARIVKRLVQAGASIDGDVAGVSTLFEAADARSARGVRMIPALVALGARETLGGAVMHAFAGWPVAGAPPSDEEMRAALTALVTVGCSLTEPDARGDSPMDDAARSGNAPVVRALLALGAAATTRSLAWAVEHPEIVRLLLAAGAPAVGLVSGVVVGYTATPLMRPAIRSSLESMRLLLSAGASVNHRNERSDTALMWSLRGKELSDMRRDADVAAVPSVVEALLNAGADVAARDRVGDTPLHALARYCATEPWATDAARLLLGSGADASAVNKAGDTPAACVPDSDDEYLYLDEESAAACDTLAELLLAAEAMG